MTRQSKRMTAIESGASTAISFVLGIFINMAVLPLFGYPINFTQSLSLVLIFNIVSYVKTYAVRRFFATLTDPWVRTE